MPSSSWHGDLMVVSSGFLTEPTLGHQGIAAHFSDDAIIAAMVRVEIALAQVQAASGIVPQEAADEIARLSSALPASDLEAGVRETGVPVPALVAALRAQLSPMAGDWVHYGATSQDIVDTALCLCYGQALDDIAVQLSGLIDALHALSKAQENTPMLARTRGQLATPITFGLRAAQWAQPLIAAEAELDTLKARALRVQFGGASGSLNVLGDAGMQITDALAAALGLSAGPPWHTDRSGLQALAAWQGRVVAALSKIGGDIAIAARGEIAEARPAQGGGSSTMPHKSNPVRAEAVQSVAVVARALEAGLAASASHAEERDGVNWPVEWALLPKLFEVTAAGLAHGTALVSGLHMDAPAMQARIDAEPAVMAEAAVFALSGTLGRVEANRLIKETLATGGSLEEVVRTHGGAEQVSQLSSKAFCEPCAQVAKRIFSNRSTVLSKVDTKLS